MPVLKLKITDEERQHIELCLKLAVALLATIQDEFDQTKEEPIDLGVMRGGVRSIPTQKIERVFAEFSVPLAERRLRIFWTAFTPWLDGVTAATCLTFQLAHMLEHVIYEPDLSRLEAEVFSG